MYRKRPPRTKPNNNTAGSTFIPVFEFFYDGKPPGGLSCTGQFSPRLDLELIDEGCNKQAIRLVFLFLTLHHMENLRQPAAISA